VQLTRLDRYIVEIAKRDPKREVDLRYRVVLLLLSGRNPEALNAWSVQLFRLNVEPGNPRGRLSEEQRTRLANRIWKLSPSAELARLLLGVAE